jgi:hypothetical protein
MLPALLAAGPLRGHELDRHEAAVPSTAEVDDPEPAPTEQALNRERAYTSGISVTEPRNKLHRHLPAARPEVEFVLAMVVRSPEMGTASVDLKARSRWKTGQ